MSRISLKSVAVTQEGGGELGEGIKLLNLLLVRLLVLGDDIYEVVICTSQYVM